MLDRLSRVALGSLFVLGAVAFGVGACGEDTAVTSTGTGASDSGPGGAGGEMGVGGMGMGGMATGGGGGMEPDCPHMGDPIIDPAAFEECTPSCGGAHCVPEALVPADTQDQLAPCTTNGGDGFCTPDKFIETGGNIIPDTCVSVGGAEGRCLSECLPDIAAQAVLLPQSTCDDGERCAPCFDPFTEEDTGACGLSCDPGPTEPPLTIECPYEGEPLIDPAVLPECDPACGGAHCLPADFVSPAEQALLAPCPGGFCAPDTLIESGGQGIPPTCTSVAGAEGRCLSTCIPDIAAQAQFLPQDTCAAGEVCAPCYDPTADDPTLPTGACELACDAAVDPPVTLTCPWTGPPVLDPATLPDCSPTCGGAHCLDASLVPMSLQSQLDTCSGGFCVPDPLIETGGNYAPPTCTAFPSTSAEGRCLSECLPDIQAQLADLQQDICPSGERCAPCTDPFDGTDTGACSISSCDAPVDPPYTFPTCCPNSNGVDEAVCVPSAMIPPDDAADLLQQTCPTDLLCVPNEYLPTPTAPIDLCNSSLGQGACVSNCVDLGLGGIFGQADCTDNHTCVPCLFGPPGCP
jgi:hypothetical protein